MQILYLFTGIAIVSFGVLVLGYKLLVDPTFVDSITPSIFKKGGGPTAPTGDSTPTDIPIHDSRSSNGSIAPVIGGTAAAAITGDTQGVTSGMLSLTNGFIDINRSILNVLNPKLKRKLLVNRSSNCFLPTNL